jgi:hypothetical protein
MNRSPFSHRPDRELGRVIREALTTEGGQEFVDGVMAQAHRQAELGIESRTSWEVLGAWARPGLVAAVLLTIAALFGAREVAPPAVNEATIDDAISQAEEAPEQTTLLLSPDPPDADVVLAVVYEP